MLMVHDHVLRIAAVDYGDPMVRAVCSPKEETNGDIILALLTLDGLEGANGETVEISTSKP